MAPRRETVTLSGRLVGMGRDVICSVRAVKVSLPASGGTADFNYVRAVIFEEPSDLLNGPYMLSYGGQTTTVRRVNGAWLTLVAE